MAYIDLEGPNAFNAQLLHCEVVYSKSQNPSEKPKPRIRITYGPARRSIAFISPPIVVDWPYLHGDGNFGTKFGPPDVDKAQFIVGLTDKAVPHTGLSAAKALFEALEQIDAVLIAFVHANQKEFLNSRDLSTAEVKGKMSTTIKSKFDDTDTLAYRRVNLATRKFDWKGEERALRVVDNKRQALDGQIAHDDVCMVALQLDCVYTGLMGSMFGCKWNVCEVMLIARAPPRSVGSASTPVDDVWGAIAVPTWADTTPSAAGFY
jgi:hypothetical protein